MRFLESTEHNSIVRDELAAEICGLVDGVDRALNLFMDDVIVRRLWLLLLGNIDFLCQLREAKFQCLDVEFTHLIIL